MRIDRCFIIVGKYFVRESSSNCRCNCSEASTYNKISSGKIIITTIIIVRRWCILYHV